MPLRVPEPRGAPPLSRTRLPASPDGAKRRSGVHPSACIADGRRSVNSGVAIPCAWYAARDTLRATRSEEHTSELQSLMRISYAVFCLKKKKSKTNQIKVTKTNTELICVVGNNNV